MSLRNTLTQTRPDGKRKCEGNAKNGYPNPAWALVEAANFAVRFCPESKRFYEHKKTRPKASSPFGPKTS
jgi:hypothetical protein